MTIANGSERVAAFFDLDGTLVAKPSLEWRFFRELRRRNRIPARNYFLWLLEAMRLAPRGIGVVRYANKMYLRGIRVRDAEQWANRAETKMAVLLERFAWHLVQGHAIVLVSGTLAPLARGAAMVLATKLAFRGINGSIEVCATELQEADGRWTGKIVGAAAFGEAKAEVVRRFALKHKVVLERSYAYADHVSDLPMLEAVGRPVVVNPSKQLHRIARQKDWPILLWRERRDLPQQGHRTPRSEEIWENLG